jgi:hypothetical protein
VNGRYEGETGGGSVETHTADKMYRVAQMFLERVAAAGGEWRARAACRGLGPELFYGKSGRWKANPGERVEEFESNTERLERISKARQVCSGCEVQEECGQWATNMKEEGVWAGVDIKSPRQASRTGKGKRSGGSRGARREVA